MTIIKFSSHVLLANDCRMALIGEQQWTHNYSYSECSVLNLLYEVQLVSIKNPREDVWLVIKGI